MKYTIAELFEIVTFVVLMFTGFAATVNKPYRLSLLSLIPFTGNEPRDGKMCQAAQQMVLDLINSRTDILPDYHLQAVYEDEGPGSMLSAKKALLFGRQFESQKAMMTATNNNYTATSYESPLILGPVYSGGCKSLGPFVQHVNKIELASACMGPPYTFQRRIYPNVYRARISTEYNSFAMLGFIRKMTNWNKIAILINAGNQYNVLVASHFYQTVITAGINVIWLDAVASVDLAVVTSLKNSGPRIIVVETVEAAFFLSFLCQTYNNGIKGPRFVFIAPFPVLMDTSTLPAMVYPDCPKAIVIEQLGITFFEGTINFALENNGKVSVLGYDLAGFEELFGKYVSSQKTPDIENRHQCHDRMLHAAITLHRTERALAALSSGSSGGNITLRDFSLHPKQIMRAINETTATSDFVGLRAGRLKYSARLEVDDEPMYIASWSPTEGLQVICKLFRADNTSDVNNASSYTFVKLSSPKWQTKDKKAPNDFANHKIEVQDIPMGAFYALTVLAAVVGASTIVGAIIVVVHRSSSVEPIGTKLAASNKLLFLTGCLVLDASAIYFSIPNIQQNSLGTSACLLRVILVAVGLSIIHSHLFLKMAFVAYEVRTARREIRMRRPTDDGLLHRNSSQYLSVRKNTSRVSLHSSVSRTTSSARMSQSEQAIVPVAIALSKRHEATICLFTICFTIANVLALAALFTADVPVLVRKKLRGDFGLADTYDEASDTFTTTYVDVCFSEYQVIVYAVMAAVHLCMLAVACFMAYEIGRGPLKHYLILTLDHKAMRIGNFNAISLFLGTIFIVAVLGSREIAHRLAISFAAPLISLISAGIAIYPQVAERLHAAH